MPVRWKIFRIICLLQILFATFFVYASLAFFFRTGNFWSFIRILLFILVFLLAVLAVNILNNNYPDTPVTGKQKTNFNRLFLLNFLFLIFLFAIIFSEYKFLRIVAGAYYQPIYTLPFGLIITFIGYLFVLVFQFLILYGLYELRRELYFNFANKEFEFEKKDQLL